MSDDIDLELGHNPDDHECEPVYCHVYEALTRRSGVGGMGEGIRIYAHNSFPGTNHGIDWHEHVIEAMDLEPVEHIAYPADEARLRDAVVEAARRLRIDAPTEFFNPTVIELDNALQALHRLDAASGDAE